MIFLQLIFVLIVLLSIGIGLLYLWFQHKFTYWSKRGVFGPKPTFPFGNLSKLLQRKEQIFEAYCQNYVKHKDLPYVGLYCFSQPVLSVHDLELVKNILIKDFDHFQTRGIYAGGDGDPLARHIFNIHGEPWKELRHKLSPTFTSNKLKTIYPLVEKISEQVSNYVDFRYSKDKAINFSEFYGKYVMEIVGSVGFGIEFEGVKDEQSDFFKYGHDFFVPQNLYWTFIRMLAAFVPDFFEKLKIRRINGEILNFFTNMITKTVEFREKNSYRRDDYLQALIDLKNGKTKCADGNMLEDESITMNEVIANTMLYMFAGYETSACVGQFAALELALNPDIQAKVREEIYRVLDKHGGKCTYEAQKEMTYFNMVIDETMRMHPPSRALFRRCTKDYQVPNSNLVIEKGVQIFIPNHAMHMDPDIFPNPEKFDPERFSVENKAKLQSCTWVPFGEGPRKCLGLQQGYISSKGALIKILQNYELYVDSRTILPLKIEPTSLTCAAHGDIWLQLKKITK